jgi:signal transduction histidine kinase
MNEHAPETANVIASIAHDLRSPLNAIIGFSRILLKGIDGPLTGMQADDLEAIHSNGKAMLAMIESLIDLARVEAGWTEPNQTSFQLDLLLEKVVALNASGAQDAGIEVLHTQDGPPLTVTADAPMTHKAIDNLLHAAIGLIESGKIEIGTRSEERNAVIALDGVNLEGIPHESSQAIESYRSAGAKPEHRVNTTALQLLTAKQLIAPSGGTLEIEQVSPHRIRLLARLPLVPL